MQDLPVDRLGQYPLLQFAAAVLVLGGLAVAIWRGTRDRRRSLADYFPGEQRIFLGGPFDQIITLLRDHVILLKEIRDQLRRIEEHVDPLGELLRIQKDRLEDIKDALQNRRMR